MARAKPAKNARAARPARPAGRKRMMIRDTGPLSQSPMARGHVGLKDPHHEISPYALPEPPPGVLPPKVTATSLAMDSGSDLTPTTQAPIPSWAWATNSYWAEGLGFMGYAYLAELTQRPEYRRPSEIIAKEMTRKFVKLHVVGDESEDDKPKKPQVAKDAEIEDDVIEDDEGDPEDAAAKAKKKAKAQKIRKLNAAIKKHKIAELFRKAAEQDGFFGRSHIYIDTGKTDDPAELALPLSLDRAKIKKKGPLKFRIVEPIWAYPGIYNANDPLKEDWYDPPTWYVMAKTVHRSRLMTFVGRPMPDILKPAYAFGGLSLSQMAKPYVDFWLRARTSVSDLIYNFSTPVIKTNLTALLNNEGSAQMVRRIDVFNNTRSNSGAMVVDMEDEDFVNVAVPLGSLDKLQAQSQEHMAAVTGIPLVVLLGITPSGLNASSDGEIRTFYAWIAAQQEHLFTDNFEKVLRILQLHLFGEIDEDIGFNYVPLWELDEAAISTKRKTDADTASVYIESGVLHPEEVREALANEEDSPYADIDVDDVPEPPESEPPPGGGLEGDEPGAEAPGGTPGGGVPQKPPKPAEAPRVA